MLLNFGKLSTYNLEMQSQYKQLQINQHFLKSSKQKAHCIAVLGYTNSQYKQLKGLILWDVQPLKIGLIGLEF